jgi:hypothetical protein
VGVAVAQVRSQEGRRVKLRVQHPPTRIPERRYVLAVLLGEFLGLDYVPEEYGGRDVRISPAADEAGPALVLPDILFQIPDEDWLTAASMPVEPLVWWECPSALSPTLPGLRRVPVLYGPRLEEDRRYVEWDGGAALGIDLFGSAFFMLTRYEEIAETERDEHDRFPARASLARRQGFLERPVVNEYLEILWAALRRLWPGLRRRTHSHQVCLTHDVDRPFCVAGRSAPAVCRSALADLALRRDPQLFARRLQAYGDTRRGFLDVDPANTFDLIMDVSERSGRKSAFYFLAHDARSVPQNSYSVDHPWIRGLIRRVHGRGHEVGAHLSYEAYADPERSRAEFQRLLQVADQEGVKQTVWGGRQHYLRWRNPDTWQNWTEAGLDYDSTLGFADDIGFRCGVCFEFPVYNLRTRQALKLTERPLIVMDGTLEDIKLTAAEACERTLALNVACKAFGGCFTLLWHNSSLISSRQQSVYREIARGL